MKYQNKIQIFTPIVKIFHLTTQLPAPDIQMAPITIWISGLLFTTLLLSHHIACKRNVDRTPSPSLSVERAGVGLLQFPPHPIPTTYHPFRPAPFIVHQFIPLHHSKAVTATVRTARGPAPSARVRKHFVRRQHRWG